MDRCSADCGVLTIAKAGCAARPPCSKLNFLDGSGGLANLPVAMANWAPLRGIA